MLLEPNINKVQEDSYRVTLLYCLAGQGKSKFMQPLIKRLIEYRNNPFKNNLSCLTPLHFAASCRKKKTIAILIASSANICVKDCYRNTPLHLAAATGLYNVFALLVYVGAQINAES